MNNLPPKILGVILGYLDETKVQKYRRVCSQWNRAIESEYGVTIVVHNGNYTAMLACNVATTAKIQNFTTHFTDPIQFSRTLVNAEFKEKIDSSNLLEILRQCSNIENLQFTGVFLNYHIPIPPEYEIHLPKLTHLKFSVNFFQEKFCRAELLVMDFLTRITTDALKSISVYSDESMSELLEVPLGIQAIPDIGEGPFNIMVTIRLNDGEMEDLIAINDSENDIQDEGETTTQAESTPTVTPTEDTFTTGNTSTQIVTQEGSTADESLQVVPTEGALGQIESEDLIPMLNTRALPNADILQTVMRTWDNGVVVPIPITIVQPVNRHAQPTTRPVASDRCTELLLKNRRTMKQLHTNFSEFRCLGDISRWNEDTLRGIQLEDVCYSFGAFRDESKEYLLLRVQHSLKTLKLFMMHETGDGDEFWDDVVRAVIASAATLEELELTLLTEDEWILNLESFATCNKLRRLIFNHYSRKNGLDVLPTSLEYLRLNGILFRQQLHSISHRLVNLRTFELHVNIDGDPIDMQFFRHLLSAPKLEKVVLIACTIGAEEMAFLRSTPGIIIVEQLFARDNACVTITIEPSFQRSILLLN